MATYAQLEAALTSCEAAIAAAESAQQWTQRSRSVQHALLKDLYARQERLWAMMSEAGDGAGRMSTVGRYTTPT